MPQEFADNTDEITRKAVGAISERIARVLADKGDNTVRQALIGLGWTPPKDE